jgi:hypothetical protein
MFPRKHVKILMAHIFLVLIVQMLFALVHVAFQKVAAKKFLYELAKNNSMARFKEQAHRATQRHARQGAAVVWMCRALILQTKYVQH